MKLYKTMFGAALVGAITAVAGFPILDDGQLNCRNLILLLMCLVLYNLLNPNSEENV